MHKTSFIDIVVLLNLDRYTMHLYFMTTYYIMAIVPNESSYNAINIVQLA
ncbi:hypothetical protein YYC_02102 [Plasmodium yoelii 17X]|uniref:Uncharacterized protein n=2 Tax=Plasmodium yoelii TaxID=5861 RepID=Q7RAK6_PLAYO|nr:hypothetical protein [Plasmodium yoelii yoelii]ETB61176.1 hypothetical protein YYC_02102 [Plasmodium yoelii 17X]